MNSACYTEQKDYGGKPYVVNVEHLAVQNQNFRTAAWTGTHLQMTVMCIPPCGEIGLEVHADTDQFIRVEQGKGVVELGNRCECCMRRVVCQGDAVFVPAGTWHNISNMGREVLRLSSIYAPPNHPKGTVHRTKAEAEREEYGK